MQMILELWRVVPWWPRTTGSTFFHCIVICDIERHLSICKCIHLWCCQWKCVISAEFCVHQNSILKFSFTPLASELIYTGSYSQKFVSVNIEMLEEKKQWRLSFPLLKADTTEKPDTWSISSTKQSKGGWTSVGQCRYQACVLVQKIKCILLAGFLTVRVMLNKHWQLNFV